MPCARTIDFTVSTRVGPGIETRWSDRWFSHASAISAGVAPFRSATFAQHPLVRQLLQPSAAAKRPMGDELDAMCDAVFDNAIEQVLVVPHAQLHLHRGDVGDAPRFVDLADLHVAQPDALDEPLVFECGERAQCCRERHAWVRRMQLIQVDCVQRRVPAGSLHMPTADGAPGRPAPTGRAVVSVRPSWR